MNKITQPVYVQFCLLCLVGAKLIFRGPFGTAAGLCSLFITAYQQHVSNRVNILILLFLALSHASRF